MLIGVTRYPAATPAASTQTYWVTDCGSPGEPVSADSASGASITSDVSVLDDDVPVVYVAEGAAPVGELITAELRGGSGDVAALDDLITVEYCGVGLSTGALFDASWARGTPATFPLSQGQLIQGWVNGILPGMQLVSGACCSFPAIWRTEIRRRRESNRGRRCCSSSSCWV